MVRNEAMRWPAFGLVFGMGFFGLAAQTLLFRDFLGIFEGSELGIAWFFGTWLVWVAAGALAARARFAADPGAVRGLEFMALLYVPAYFLQSFLIAHAREIAGVRPYELFPIARMLPAAFIANAPVSLCTGFLFTRACAWMAVGGRNPVARVYAAEAAGGFAGGVGVTLLLAGGVPDELVLALSALLLALLSGVCRLSRRAYATALLPALAVAAAVLARGPQAWETANHRAAWQRLMPAGAYRGHFATPQARYLYGEYHGQFTVMAWQSIADTVPGTEQASQTIALLLAQNPAARRFLVVGSGGFSICRRLQDLPQAEVIEWADADPDYPARLLDVLPPGIAGDRKRVQIPRGDIRRHLKNTADPYDLIILSLPPATTLTLNRHLTREFFLLARQRLTPTGVIGVRVPGGENFMGDEVVNAGASVYSTLGAVFGRLIVKPGDETWIIASEAGPLSDSPAELRDRFRAIPGAPALYPPDGLLSLYLPDRVEFQTRQYRRAAESVPPGVLLNTDRHPRALLHALLLAAREMGAGGVWAARLRRFALDGMPVVPAGIALVALLRFVYLRRTRDRAGKTGEGVGRGPFDDQLLVLSTGAAGMAASLVMMFMYQSAFGAIFLHAGLISALFMLGLFGGATAAARLLARDGGAGRRLLPAGLTLHIGLVTAVMFLPDGTPAGMFAALFFCSGLLAGIYVPVAAWSLKRGGMADGAAGAVLEWHDHLGGAAGGLLVGLVLLPVFGGPYALAVTALLLAVNLPPALAQGPAPHAGIGDRFDGTVRAAGYTAFGIAAFVLAGALFLRPPRGRDAGPAFLRAAREMAGPAAAVERHHRLPDGRAVEYCEVYDAAGRLESCIFRSDFFGPEVQGYGGPLVLAVRAGADGMLQDFRIIRSDETPAYLDALAGWVRRLAGHALFTSDPLAGVDTVTGATVSSEAILRALRQAGPGFARDVLGRDVGAAAPPSGRSRDWRVWILAAAAGAALLLRRRPSRRARWIVAALVAVAAGFVFNIQYSSSQVLTLLGMRLPPPGAGIEFWLVMGIPCLVLLAGNVYCGYLCPFGLLQDLAGDLGPRAWRVDPGRSVWRWARLVKYLLLFAMVVLFGLSLDRGLATWDPLVVAFSSRRTTAVTVGLLVLLALALVYRRFWCRTLCPAGAFLSLLNGVRLLGRWVPGIVPAQCRYGVRSAGDLDCLCCDYCRCPAGPETGAGGGRARQVVFLALVAAGAILVFDRMADAHRAAGRGGEVRRGAAGFANARNVDMARLRRKIRDGELSGHEARGYHKVEPGAAGGQSGK